MPVPSFNPNDFDVSPSHWALAYRQCGWQVIPGYAPGETPSWKRPMLSEWRTLQEALVPDETFARWYDPAKGEYRSRANMGLLTGRCSGNQFVVDLDSHKNPLAAKWWRALMVIHNNSMELETVEQQTGGGGRQKLFVGPPGWVSPTNKTRIGVDIRGQGGFAVLPPSRHDSGGTYQWLPGFAPWEHEVAVAPQWLLDAVQALIVEHGGGDAGPRGKSPVAASPAQYDAYGQQTDARETLMRDMVHASILNWWRENPIRPSDAESLARGLAEYEVYERQVAPQRGYAAHMSKRAALEEEGRGITEWWSKWHHLMRRWDTDVAGKAALPNPNANPNAMPDDFARDFTTAAHRAKAAGNVYRYLTVKDILARPKPRWVIDKLVIEQGLGFIYGPPGSVKTFIALDIALTLATKQSNWWGYPVNHCGTVIYILAEGTMSLGGRLLAWQRHRGVAIESAPFVLIEETINFMKAEDVGKLLNTVQAVQDTVGGPIAAVFVDTVSRVLPGAKENQQEDMTLFIAACDAVRQRFFATVFGLHHTNYAGGMRGSTVMPGAGDFLIEAKREPGAMTGSIVARKVKDGEDGWERNFKVVKVPADDLGTSVSLVIDGTDDHPAATGEGLPHKDTCRQILAAIHEQWTKGQPWCFSANSPRCAEKNIGKRWNIERKTVTRLLEHWHANGIIEEAVYSSKTRVKGYKKLIDI